MNMKMTFSTDPLMSFIEPEKPSKSSPKKPFLRSILTYLLQFGWHRLLLQALELCLVWSQDLNGYLQGTMEIDGDCYLSDIRGLGKEKEGIMTGSRKCGAMLMAGHEQLPDKGEAGGCSARVRCAFCFQLSSSSITSARVWQGREWVSEEEGKQEEREREQEVSDY